MVGQAFDQVEQSEAQQDRADQAASGPVHRASAHRAPDHHQGGQHEAVGGHVEDAVPKRVDLQVVHAVGRKAGAADHVVPLQHLVQHDAVEEAAQAQAEQDAAGKRERSV